MVNPGTDKLPFKVQCHISALTYSLDSGFLDIARADTKVIITEL